MWTDAGALRGARPWGFFVPACLALVVALSSAAIAAYLSHGLSVTYYVTQRGGRQALFQTVEHRPLFGSETRPLGQYAQHWDFRRFPQPGSAPPLDLVMRGTIVAPRPGLSLAAESKGEVTLLIDGRPAASPTDAVSAAGLGAGRHALELRFLGKVVKDRRQSLGLFWVDAQGRREPLSFYALAPHASEPLATWTLGLGTLLALGLLLLTRAMKRHATPLTAPIVQLLLLLTLLGVGAGLRGFEYDLVPDFRENGDELFAMWNGFSLLDEGQTRGWSLWASRYGGRVDVERRAWFGTNEFQVITPYFEHPPLLHVMVGALGKLGGATRWYEVQHRHARLVAVGLNLLTLWLLLAIGQKLAPRSAMPYFAAFLYAVLPNVVLQGRVIKEEALLTPMILLGAYLFLLSREREDFRYALASALVFGAATWAKMTGGVGVLVLVIWLCAERSYREAFWAAVLGFGSASLILLYGALIDWSTFWFATVYQATNRPKHFNLLLRFFDDALINHSLVGRGQLLFLWLSFLVWISRQAARPRRFVLVPLLIYLFAIAVPSGNWTFGWYAQPLYPWLCLGAGAFLAEAFERPTLLHGTLIVGVLTMYGINFTMTPAWAKDAHHWPLLRASVTAYVALGMAPYVLYEAFPKAKVSLWLGRATTALALVAFFGLSVHQIVRYDELHFTHENFDRDKFFDR